MPWTNAALREAGTVHIGGTRAEIAAAEGAVARGAHAERPYVLGAEPTVVDPSRAPAGKHVFWAYAHVPAGSDIDQTEAITRQIERFAPGFRDTVLQSSSRTAVDMGAYNPNYVGGDIAAGAASFWQLVKRPVLSSDPWRMGGGMYLCSEASAPGPGVHGMAGWHAARSTLRHNVRAHRARRSRTGGLTMAKNVRILHCRPEDVFDVFADGWLFTTWVVGASRMRGQDDGGPRSAPACTTRSASGRS